ncbi:hypothetical protein JNL27_05020 [bacterium]|nr:hypothetical protein [bacterium]
MINIHKIFLILMMAALIFSSFYGPSSTYSAYASSADIMISVSDTPFVKIPHRQFEFPCEVCHTTDSWKVIKSQIAFDHTRTGFPLLGAHERANCQGCHGGGLFNTSVRECAVCHKEPHQGELGPDCERCHNETAWTPSTFNHNDHIFIMIGAHRGLDCADCHRNLMTFKMPNVNQCSDCHKVIGAPPQHAQWEALGDCLACHTMNSWDDYPHLDEWFSLTGHHRRSCETCHKNAPNYTTHSCRDCHRFDTKDQANED